MRYGARAALRGKMLVLAAAMSLALPLAANAEFKLRYPDIDENEVEIEHNYSATFDSRSQNNARQSTPTEIGIGVLPFWEVELEGEASKELATSGVSTPQPSKIISCSRSPANTGSIFPCSPNIPRPRMAPLPIPRQLAACSRSRT